MERTSGQPQVKVSLSTTADVEGRVYFGVIQTVNS
jgi:hypothetical protein